MSQDQLLEKIRNNPGIEQCRLIDPNTSCNSRQLKALLRFGLIRREIHDRRYHLYVVEGKNETQLERSDPARQTENETRKR